MTYNFNISAWLIASLVSFVAGFLWFGPKTFFPVWWKAMGRPEGEGPTGQNMGMVFGLTLLGILVQNAVLGVFLGALEVESAAEGFHAALMLSIGLAAFTSLSHRLFAGHNLKVWAIEVTSDVLNLSLAGAIFGAFLAA